MRCTQCTNALTLFEMFACSFCKVWHALAEDGKYMYFLDVVMHT